MARQNKRGPGHDTVLRKEACPECGSKDNLVRYADGHAHCFSAHCDHWEPAWKDGETQQEVRKVSTAVTGLLRPDEASFRRLEARDLSEETLRKFGYFTTMWRGERVQVAPYFDSAGSPTMQKVRTKDKEFFVLKAEDAPDKPLNAMWLYGRHVWGDKHDRKVVVFTGEHDAHAAAEVTKFKFPCVSVNTGDQGALKCLKANYLWLDRFEEIILFFDNDESGQSIVADCARLFDAGKVKIAKIEGVKDASQAKQDKTPGKITEAIYAAYTWRPKGIVNAMEGAEEFVRDGLVIASWPYPFPKLEEKTRGQRRGEVTFHIGGTGIAKTTLLYHYETHLAKWQGREEADAGTTKDETHPVKIGHLGFEDTLRSVKMGLLSIHAGRRLHMDPVSPEELTKIYKDLFGTKQIELYDPANAEMGKAAIEGYIKYMVKALGCVKIVVDPLSMLVAMLGTGGSRVEKEDEMAAHVAFLAKSLNCSIDVSHHLKKADGKTFEEGASVSMDDIRGSGAFSFFASNIFAYERDQQGNRPDLLRVRILKCRHTGNTGVADILQYDTKTGRYSVTNEEWPEDEDKRNSKPSGFPKVSGVDDVEF
jgi:twinkle protein